MGRGLNFSPSEDEAIREAAELNLRDGPNAGHLARCAARLRRPVDGIHKRAQRLKARSRVPWAAWEDDVVLAAVAANRLRGRKSPGRMGIAAELIDRSLVQVNTRTAELKRRARRAPVRECSTCRWFVRDFGECAAIPQPPGVARPIVDPGDSCALYAVRT